MTKTVRPLLLLVLSLLVTTALFASVTLSQGVDLDDAIETSIRAAHADPPPAEAT